jgi:N12 class adenine-specific DNA methylase
VSRDIKTESADIVKAYTDALSKLARVVAEYKTERLRFEAACNELVAALVASQTRKVKESTDIVRRNTSLISSGNARGRLM